MKQEKLATDVVVLAYFYVRAHGVQNSTLCERYGLRAKTLTVISREQPLTRNREKYMQSFVRELRRLRGKAEMAVQTAKIAVKKACMADDKTKLDVEKIKLKEAEDKIAEIRQQLANIAELEYCPEAKIMFP